MLDPAPERDAGSTDPKRRRNLLIAMAVSFGLHGLVLIGLLRVELQRVDQYVPVMPPLQVQLVPANPLSAPEPPDPLTAELALAQPGPPPQPETPAPLLPPVQPAVLVESPRVELPPQESAEPAQAPPLPMLSVRDSLQRSLQQQRDAVNPRQPDCNRLERDAGIVVCDDDTAAAYDFDAVELNPVYRNLNPVRELSRTQRSLAMVSQATPQLASRLDELALPAGVPVYLMEQLEGNITHLSNPGNRSLQMMKELTASPVQQQAARVLGDPWVLNQYRLKQQRQRHIIPLTQGEVIRNTVINLGLIWVNLELGDPRR